MLLESIMIGSFIGVVAASAWIEYKNQKRLIEIEYRLSILENYRRDYSWNEMNALWEQRPEPGKTMKKEPRNGHQIYPEPQKKVGSKKKKARRF